jgi:hypothetical protein
MFYRLLDNGVAKLSGGMDKVLNGYFFACADNTKSLSDTE